MKKQHTVLLAAILPFLSLAGCGSGNHTAQNHHSASQSSAQKGEDKMPTQSPMLNEIFSNEIPIGQSQDVSDIVSKYIPVGTSKEQTKKILVKMNQKYSEEDNIIHAGYGIKEHPMVPKRGVRITLKYNKLGFLENIEANLTVRL